jgi:hypothetical protein
VITLFKTPVYLDETITITSGSNITLTANQWTEQEIQRRDVAGGMIVVESGASLTLGGAGGGLIIDGADAATNAALISVTGNFAMKNGVTLKGGKKGGVIVNSGGVFTMSGGEISDNAVSGLVFGGGVGVGSGGVFTMSGGEISGNTATVVGGGVGVGSGGEFTMSGGEISGNTAATGGGVYMNSGGEFTMSGGEISGNAATNNGGGVSVGSGGEFTMSGGEISGNTAATGGGVYVNSGEFTMSGTAFVDQNNAVYLAENSQITVTGTLSPPNTAASNFDAGKNAKIAVDSDTERLVIKCFSAADIDKFSVDGGEIELRNLEGWFIPANNEDFSVTVTTASSTAKYETLSAAVENAASGSVITLLKKAITLSETVNITSNKDITLKVTDGETYTIERASGMTGSLFSIDSGATLTLDGGEGGLIIDGAEDDTGARLVSVMGVFAMEDGVTLTGGEKGGVVVNSGGAFTMSGGEINGNTAPAVGGGVVVNSGGVFTMSGGEISDNAVSGIGDGAGVGSGVVVMSGGAFTMSGGEISGNTAPVGGGVVVNSGGAFTMSGGEISGNTATNYGGGVVVNSGGVFTMAANAVVAQEVYLPTGITITVSGSEPLDPSPFEYSAIIAMANVGEGCEVLAGADEHPLTDYDISKFKLNADPPMSIVLSGGKGVTTSANTDVNEYDSLAAAIAASNGSLQSPAVISLASSIEVTAVILVEDGKHVKIVPAGEGGGGDVTISRGSGFTSGSLFTVSPNASLTLAGGDNAQLVLDGGTAQVYGSLVYVPGGSLTMGDGVILQNNQNTSDGGGVYIVQEGVFTMTGGIIQGGEGISGGGVNLGANDSCANVFNFSGGVIQRNSATGNGGGITVTSGSVSMSGDAKIMNNQTSYIGGGGVMLETGMAFFQMSGGTIAGNKSQYDGGGVLVSAGVFIKTGGVVYGNDSEDVLNNIAAKDGAALCNYSYETALSTTNDTF